MREIVLDTETTGLDPASGHRVVEIGCLELKGRIPTGRTFHCYLNPERDMPDEAFRVHGLSTDFLKTHKTFDRVVDDFLHFIADDTLVIHNARFDMKFLNFELTRLDRPALAWDRVVDTLSMAKGKFPGSPASLDALCKRFDISNVNRTLHGALIDAELLAAVYLELTGGRQLGFVLNTPESPHIPGSHPLIDSRGHAQEANRAPQIVRPVRSYAASVEEEAGHRAFLDKIKNPIWLASRQS